jgi:hypothetical protein
MAPSLSFENLSFENLSFENFYKENLIISCTVEFFCGRSVIVLRILNKSIPLVTLLMKGNYQLHYWCKEIAFL